MLLCKAILFLATLTLLQRVCTSDEKLGTLARQLMLQQFYAEEQTRASGASGLKLSRVRTVGSEPWVTPTFGSNGWAAIHEHSNYKTTLGLGELIVVLNGVEFRTRHNDYQMRMKSRTSTKYGETEEMEFPDVPPEVLNYTRVADQMAEMKAWFRAWRDQDTRVRDYRKYFKPTLCYLEGMWTYSDQHSIEESFDSERHHLAARSWMEMQDKARFTSYTGNKDILENFALLPTTIIEAEDDGSVKIAQWNFQILCHPIEGDLPLSRLQLVDDVQVRMALDQDLETYKNSRGARFEVKAVNKTGDENTQTYRWNFLDKLMEQIPGLDNYVGDIQDDAFGDVAYPNAKTATEPLNAAYYHRFYRSLESGAMGTTSRKRAFGDESIFMAMNTQEHIAGLGVEHCSDEDDPDTCQSWSQKMSFAIPLEIVYRTPLTNWNPFRIDYRGGANTPEGRSIFDGPDGERTGGEGVNEAFAGSNSHWFYHTPAKFYTGNVGSDPADTVEEYINILSKSGKPQKVTATGHRIMLNITDVGLVRQRFPIMPLHEEGSATWKHLQALAKIVLNPAKYAHLFPNVAGGGEPPEPENTVYVTGPSSPETGSHVHEISLTHQQIEQLANNETVTANTNNVIGYQHPVEIKRIYKVNAKGERYDVNYMDVCDHLKNCPDGHPRRLWIKNPAK